MKRVLILLVSVFAYSCFLAQTTPPFPSQSSALPQNWKKKPILGSVQTTQSFKDDYCKSLAQRVGDPIEGVYMVSLSKDKFVQVPMPFESINFTAVCIEKIGSKYYVIWPNNSDNGTLQTMRYGRLEYLPNRPEISFQSTSSPARFTGSLTEVATGNQRGFNASLSGDGILQFTYVESTESLEDALHAAYYSLYGHYMDEYNMAGYMLGAYSRWTFTLAKVCEPMKTAVKASPKSGSGSCVVVDAKAGVICTNYHVVKGSRTRYIKFRGESFALDLVAKDEKLDLAILKIRSTVPAGLVALPVEVSCSLGEEVFAAGYPRISDLGESLKVTDGVVSSTSFMGNSQSLQVSCPITNGNSGGALLNKKGELVGITQSGYRPDMNTENVNGAIKSLNLLMLLQTTGIEPNLTDGGGINFDHLSNSVLPIFVRY